MRLFTLSTFLLLTVCGLTAQSPVQLLDINPGADNSSPTRFFRYGDRALFRATTPDEGTELWITDGTTEGTMMVKDINTDPELSRGNSNPDMFTEYNGKVYFRARSAGAGDELWVTDGTSEGTMMVKDIRPGEDNGAPFDLIVYDDLLYFTATTDEASSELWATDGTEEGTRMVADINPGGGTSNPNFKVVFDGKLYFTAVGNEVGNELWVSDGTADGTTLVADIDPEGNGFPSQYFAYRDRLYFRADDGVTGRELWSTDGTTAGTMLVADILEGEEGSSPDDLFAVAGMLFFTADTEDAEDELVALDVATGEIASKNINPAGSDDPRELLTLIDTVAYVLVGNTDTEAGTDLFILSGFDGKLDISEAAELSAGLAAADPEDLTWTGNSLYFTYETEETGREIAGIQLLGEEGTQRFDEIVAGETGGSVDDLFLVGNRLLFEADDTQTGRELWAADVMTAYVTPERENGETLMDGDTLDFGTVSAGIEKSIMVVFNNRGNANSRLYEGGGELNVDGLEAELVNSDDDDHLPPAPGNAFLNFVLERDETGAFFDTLSVYYLSASRPRMLTFYISGNVVANVLEVTAAGETVTNGDTLTFNGVAVGTDSLRVLSLRNGGQGELRISSVKLTKATLFTVTRLSDTLAAGESVNLAVSFSPTADTVATDTLTIATNGGDFTIVLSGNTNTTTVIDRGLPARAVYPNPTSGRLNIELTAPLSGGDWRLTNLNGQVLRTGRWPEGRVMHDIDLSALLPGIYQVEVMSGERRLTARVMKR